MDNDDIALSAKSESAWVMDNIMSKRPEPLLVIEAVTTSHKCQIKACRA